MRYHDEVVAREGHQPADRGGARQRVAALEAALTTANETLTKTTDVLSHTAAELASVMQERDKLRRAYELLKAEVELSDGGFSWRSVERIDTEQLFARVRETNDSPQDARQNSSASRPGQALAVSDEDGGAEVFLGPRAKPKGPNLRDLDIPEVRVEILDPSLEGIAERDFENLCQLGDISAAARFAWS